MNLQTALVVLAVLGVNVNGLPALEPKALRPPLIEINALDCEMRKPFCTQPEETGRTMSQQNSWTQRPLRSLQPTQRPTTETRPKTTEGFGLQPKPNSPKDAPPSLDTDIGTLKSTTATPSAQSSATPFGKSLDARAPPTTTHGGANFRPVTLVSGRIINDETPSRRVTTWPSQAAGGVIKRAIPSSTAAPPSSPPMRTVCLHYDVTLEGDTCDTITAQNRLTLDDLKAINNSPANICATMKPGQKYCVNDMRWLGGEHGPDALTSKPTNKPQPKKGKFLRLKECVRRWIVGPTDTCESIAKVAGISVKELVALNPEDLGDCKAISGTLCLRAATPFPPPQNASP
ncbi:hypothetical protein AJ78_05442 [Emergomyces pasteurianus Ep9510]|uniref:LysM domain-containing protein n=1 Tax=Emergomyces pasteurianus Ep9510 TaxID=1447872 RepID=A0A1J9PDT7_9EURO|nr:hypothetical protein AJ78_05442 [Emergomyces pasteurianus Ep9510]